MRGWSRGLAALSLLLAAAVSGALLVLPVYATGETLIAVSGPWVLLSLAAPVVVAGLAVASGWHRRAAWARIGAAALLCCWVLISGFSVGLYYVPSALVMVAAAGLSVLSALGRTRRGRPVSREP